MTTDTARSRPWLAAGAALSVAGSAMLLIGSAWWLAVGPHPAAWSSIPGLVVGGIGLAGALGTRSRPERAALVAAAVGPLALVPDFVGGSGAPGSSRSG